MADTEFLAYVHARPSTRTVDGIFYVGKGKRSRSLDVLQGRNRYHARVVEKHGAGNILVGTIPCSSEKIAFELERGLIKCLRRMGVKLTNMTDGGEGTSGHVLPEEQRRAIGLRQLAAVAAGTHHTQNQTVVEKMKFTHQKAVKEGTHPSVVNNPMKRPEIAAKSKAARDAKGRAQPHTVEEIERIRESNRVKVADGSHHFLTNHPMKNPEVAARQSAKVRGRKKMVSASGEVKMIPQESIPSFIANGWTLSSKKKEY